MILLTPHMGEIWNLAVLLAMACVIEALLGWLEPVRTWRRTLDPFARLSELLARRLDRPGRGERNVLVRGLVVALVILGFGALLGWLIAFMAGRVDGGALLVLAALLPVVSWRGEVSDLLRSIRAGRGDAGDVTGPAVALLRGIWQPAIWLLLLGLPGLFAATALASAARGAGDRSTFGFVLRRADAVVAVLPMLGSGLAITLAALLVPKARPDRALIALTGRVPWGPSPFWPASLMSRAAGEGDARTRLRRVGVIFAGDLVLSLLALAAVALADLQAG